MPSELPPSPSIKESIQEALDRLFSPLTAFVWLACIIVASTAGPFGTLEDMILPVRTLFWTIVATLGALISYGARAIAMMVAGPFRPVRFDLVAIAATTILFSPTIWIVGYTIEVIFGANVPGLHVVALYVFLTSGMVFVVRRLAPGFEAVGYGFLDAPEPPQPRLMRWLELDVLGNILRLSANGHHVDVVTSQGTRTLRLRLADAVHEMEPVIGFLVHRSHWVAHGAIERAEQESSQKTLLVLKNGDRVPVGRTFRPQLQDAGILD